MTIGATNYKFTPNTLVYSGNNQLKISDLSATDVLSVVGVNRDIVSVTVTSGHGYLHITDFGVAKKNEKENKSLNKRLSKK